MQSVHPECKAYSSSGFFITLLCMQVPLLKPISTAYGSCSWWHLHTGWTFKRLHDLFTLQKMSGALAKQLHQCLKNLHSFTAGQVQMVDCDWDDLGELTMNVSPSDGLYKGGIYNFKVLRKSVYRSTMVGLLSTNRSTFRLLLYSAI